MKLAKYGRRALLLVVALFASLATYVGVAHATSAYDDVMFAQQSVQIPNWVNSQWEYLDVSANWYDYIQAGTAKDSLDDARANGGHWMLVDLQDNLTIIWSSDPSVSTSFFSAYGQPSWGIDSGNTWNVIRLSVQNGVVSQTSFLGQTGQNAIYIGNKPNPLTQRTGLVFSTYPNTNVSGYAGEPIPSQLPPAKYVAMGDSFSSGEGNSPFEVGTDTSTDKCHRSFVAYPRLLQSALNLGATAFVACSGATTGAITGTFNTEAAQVDALSNDTQVVTITIGGNDVGFPDYATACTETLCGPGTFDYNYIMNAINTSSFYDSLTVTYESILSHAPNAQVYVSGYPFMATQTSDVCGQDDLTGAWAVEGQLNAVISAAVSDVKTTLQPTTHLHYVDPNLSSSPFAGKYLCNGGASDFNGLNLFHREYSFHPNAAGHQDFASVFESQMS